MFNNQSANPRVGDKLKQAGLVPDNSPTHGLVLSELIFYRENLRFMSIPIYSRTMDRKFHRENIASAQDKSSLPVVTVPVQACP